MVDMWYEQFYDKTGTGWAKLALANRIAEYREEITRKCAVMAAECVYNNPECDDAESLKSVIRRVK